MLHMLRGAAETLAIGDPLDPATDIGPVIDEDARSSLQRAVAQFGSPLFMLPLPPGTEHGSFFAPRAFLLRHAGDLTSEIFGPVLCVVRYAADLLNGVPSIVIGIFAYALAVLPFKHFSTWAGAFALGVMMIPITLRSTEEFLHAVPRALREGSMALGASKWRTIMSVVVPAAYRGIMTAILLALARVAGETAPLLFTALGNRYWSPGFNQPTASLPAMIYSYALSPYDDWHRQAWAAGLVLLALILIVNIFARAILSRGGTILR